MNERSLEILEKYLPERSVKYVYHLLNSQSLKLKIVADRKSKYGDFRFTQQERDIITINHNLSKDQFLFTLLHEIAHKMAFDKYGRHIRPHGKEWKHTFHQLLMQPAREEYFSAPVSQYLSLIPASRLKSSVQGDARLYHLMHKKEDSPYTLLSELTSGNKFVFNSKKYELIRHLRSYSLCRDTLRGQLYKVHQLAEVMPDP